MEVVSNSFGGWYWCMVHFFCVFLSFFLLNLGKQAHAVEVCFSAALWCYGLLCILFSSEDIHLSIRARALNTLLGTSIMQKSRLIAPSVAALIHSWVMPLMHGAQQQFLFSSDLGLLSKAHQSWRTRRCESTSGSGNAEKAVCSNKKTETRIQSRSLNSAGRRQPTIRAL